MKPAPLRERILRALQAPKDTAGLVVFRVALGVLGAVSAIRFLAFGWVEELFAQPRFFFKYFGFGWVQVGPLWAMQATFVALAVLGVCIALGAFTRLALACFVVLFAYVNLCDVTNYLNHYVQVFWLAVLALAMPLGRAHSIDVKLNPTRRLEAFPAWCIYLLRFQVGVVYFYAGIAKLNADWLVHGQPLSIWLHARSGFPVLGPLFARHDVALAMSWAGFLFDTTIPLWLSLRRTRVPAYVVLIGFHGLTQLLFPIGMFPAIMVLSALVFFPPEQLGAWLRRLPLVGGAPVALRASPRRLHPAWVGVGAAYCLLHLLVPLRHRLYDGSVSWHEQGMRFAWKVMVREKNATVTYLVHDDDTGRSFEAYPHTYLTPRQLREFATQPDMILALAHHVAADFRARGMRAPRVHADTWVSLNGRPKARLIDPSVDLTTVHDGFGRARWIAPEPTTLPHRFHAVASHAQPGGPR